MSVSRNMELRHLTISQTSRLSQILDHNESWKSLMENIPRNLSDIHNETDSNQFTRKYSAENIQQIDMTSKELHRSPTTILLDEWGTSGRRRATVSDLLDLLISVQLYRAADFVAKDILNATPPKRPQNGPGAKINISLPPEKIDEKAVEEFLQNAPYPDSSLLVEHLDSILNNNNRDFSNSVSVDHVKKIDEFLPTSSEEFISEHSESESHSDLIEFSVKTLSTHNQIVDDQPINQISQSVYASESFVHSEISNNNDISLVKNEKSVDNRVPNLPPIIGAIVSFTSKENIDSITDQLNSSLIPDIDNLKIKNESNSFTVLSDEINSTEQANGLNIPMLSLLNGSNDS